jgi:hypothetical protein
VYRKDCADKVVDPVADTKDEAPGLDTLIVLAAGAAGAPAALTIATGAAPAAVKEQKKRKPKFSPGKYDATTSEEEKDDDMDNFVPTPPPAPLEGLRSPTDPFTLTELEDMHTKIVQECAPLIDGFIALNIFEVSYVEHKLKEIKTLSKKIMTVTISTSSSSKKLISCQRRHY